MKVFADNLAIAGRPAEAGERLEYVIVLTKEEQKDLKYKQLLGNKMRLPDMYLDNSKEEYILLEINCSVDKLILHTNPNYKLGYFTYDNINPKNILIIKENL